MQKITDKILQPFTFRKLVSFTFDGSIDEGIQLISEHLKSPVTLKDEEALAGKAALEKIFFRYHKRFYSPAITPVFTGKFISKNNQTILRGEFEMDRWQKIIYIFLSMLVFLLLTIFLGDTHDTVRYPLINFFSNCSAGC